MPELLIHDNLKKELKNRVDHVVIHSSNKEGLIRGKIFSNVHKGELQIRRSEVTFHSIYFPGLLQN